MLLWDWLGKSEINSYRLELSPRAEAAVHRQIFSQGTPSSDLKVFQLIESVPPR